MAKISYTLTDTQCRPLIELALKMISEPGFAERFEKWEKQQSLKK